jgi:DNA-binding HxlR family transcriptional regulator
MPRQRRTRAQVPLPRRVVRGSRTGRPLMAAFDLLGHRWTLRILWELRSGPLGFRALQHACDDLSPTLLNGRLRELKSAALVVSGEGGYTLTRVGRRLLEALAPLNDWAELWSKAVR